MSNYNPRYGDAGGRVRKDDFSIDGKSWNYRDPSQHNARTTNASRSGGGPNYNRHASSEFDQLYDYSYGQARDAAKALGIGNVNDKEEADRIVDYIQNPPKAETETNKTKPKKTKDPIPNYMDPAKPIKLSPRVVEANATISAYNQRFDSPASQTAYDLKDKYSLNLQSGVGKRGQKFKSLQSTGWDNGISQEFFDKRRNEIAKNLERK